MTPQFILAVAAGGAIGSVARYLVGIASGKMLGPNFPWGRLRTSCWRRKLRSIPTSVARWPWRTDFSCLVDFIAPDGRAENLRMVGKRLWRSLP